MKAVIRFLSRWSTALANRALLIGQQAYKCGDYATALREFRTLANQGNTAAQFFLGTMYRNGDGVSASGEEAARWIRLAAEQAMADAQFSFGVLYDDGEGVAQDSFEAARWYRLAAQQGCASAQFNLGTCFHEGRGVKQDETKAAWWITLAAEQGAADAQLNLGIRYLNGIGVLRDDMEAYLWFDLAVANGSADAVTYRDIVAQGLTPDQATDAHCRARDWKPKSRAESALDVYSGEVAEFFQTLNEGPSNVPAKEILGLLDRVDDLIDVGVVLGAAAENLKILREAYHALAGDLARTVPEVREFLARSNSLKELKRAPGFRQWLARPR